MAAQALTTSTATEFLRLHSASFYTADNTCNTKPPASLALAINPLIQSQVPVCGSA